MASTSLRTIIAWRPSWWLQLAVAYSLSEAESCRAMRKIAESNVHEAREHMKRCEAELRKVDYAIQENDRLARNGSLELARRGAQ